MAVVFDAAEERGGMSSLEAILCSQNAGATCWSRSCHKLEQPQGHYRDRHGQGTPATPPAQVVGRTGATGAIMPALWYPGNPQAAR